jgi:hypothetical protein
MKRLLLLAILLYPVALLCFWIYRGMVLHQDMPNDTAASSLASRLSQYRPAARARLQPFFETAEVTYPPARVVLLALKQEKILEVYAAATNGVLRFVHAYPMLAASGSSGPKLREGDQQVPEGIYPVESLNPNSKFHLALRLGYPNAFDLEQARLDGRDNLGSDIMIHGGAASVGCLAVGDEAAEDLFVLAADAGLNAVTVIISPVDFRKTADIPSPPTNLPPWTASLYQTLKSKLNELPPEK